MMTFHFYFKLLNSEYGKLYEMHPLKHHLMKFADSYLGLDDLDKKTKKNIEENLALCQDLGFKDVVYVPYCLCLISKFPYIRQMEVCLQSLYNIMSGFKTNGRDNINEIIMFLINSYTTGLSKSVLENILKICVNSHHQGFISSDELGLPMKNSDLVLPCGIYARWEKEKTL